VVVEQAYTACQRLAAAHYENFPVASWLLPKESRPHVAAIYAFARTADDMADEGDVPAAARLSNLEQWQWRLHEAVAGRVPSDGTPAEPIFTALSATIHKFGLDVQLLEDLLSAFAQDVVVTRYETWADLLDYCRRSANPIGRLVLHVHRHRDALAERQSDAICTALQLTNFWQDLAIDWRRGRLYVPRDVQTAAGAQPELLDDGAWPSAWQTAVRDAVTRTRALFAQGRPLSDRVDGRLRHQLRATWLGGVRILDKLEANDCNVFLRRPRIGWPDAAAIAYRTVRWK
jgi:hydroxysqualene synthase